jgi:hypothetical protein
VGTSEGKTSTGDVAADGRIIFIRIFNLANTVMQIPAAIKGREFLDKLSDCKRIEKDSIPWI